MSDLVRDTVTVTLDGARMALESAVRRASAMGVWVCVAVADAGGELVAFARMDGAPLLSAGTAQDKAYTVCAFGGVPTHEWYSMIENEPPLLHGIVKTPRLVVFGGGVPLRADGVVVGAVGVSGGSAEQDRAIAEAGAAALEGAS
jgi:glc operon protein GlcG